MAELNIFVFGEIFFLPATTPPALQNIQDTSAEGNYEAGKNASPLCKKKIENCFNDNKSRCIGILGNNENPHFIAGFLNGILQKPLQFKNTHDVDSITINEFEIQGMNKPVYISQGEHIRKQTQALRKYLTHIHFFPTSTNFYVSNNEDFLYAEKLELTNGFFVNKNLEEFAYIRCSFYGAHEFWKMAPPRIENKIEHKNNIEPSFNGSS